jgi:hypothetical protein
VNVPGDGFIRLKWAGLAGAGLILIMLAVGAVGSAFNRPAAEPPSPTGTETDGSEVSMPAEQIHTNPEESPTPQPFEQAMMIEIVLPTLAATSPFLDAEPEDLPPASLPEITPAPVEPTQPAVLAPSPTQAATPSPTQAPRLGSISGRATLNGQPVGSTFKLVLEDSQQSPLFNAWPAQDGAYAFTNLPAAVSGYTLVFERSEQDGFDIKDVISWGWLGPIIPQEGQDLTLPDFELGYLSFEHIHPEPYASLSANSISPVHSAGIPVVGVSWWRAVLGRSGKRRPAAAGVAVAPGERRFGCLPGHIKRWYSHPAGGVLVGVGRTARAGGLSLHHLQLPGQVRA